MSDLSGTMRSLNEREELILNCIEAQLTQARTVRYLSGEVDNRTEADLQALVTELAGDVAGVKEHAAFEHEKVRYLQSAVTNTSIDGDQLDGLVRRLAEQPVIRQAFWSPSTTE